MLGPGQHREQVGIGDGERAAHQIILAFELLGHPVKALTDLVLERFLVLGGRRRIKQRAELLVQLGGYEVQPLLQVVSLHAAGGRG